MMKAFLLAVLALAACGAAAQEKPSCPPPAPFGVVPTPRQLRWHALEYYGFVHFTVNTFTNKEWGGGEEDPKIFNPTELDPRQWARAARDAGMKGLILTAKHHDGFCLWPSKHTEHSVKNSPWKGGKGDLMREFADACREFGLKVGVYLSPWDRNHAQYARPEYVEYYRQQLDELLTQYGEIFEVWHDGANGGTGYYGGAKEKRTIDAKTYYGFPAVWERVRKLQPDAVIFSDAGPDIRWVGNERGTAPDPCWARINPEGIFPGIADTKRLSRGDPDGAVWRPAEVDVSIRKGWFFHANEQPKSLRQLLDIWYASVGNGCCLLLNVPPDRRGLFHEEDVKRLAELRAVLDDSFKTDLAKGKAATASNVRGNDPAYAAGKAADGDRASFWATDDAVREATLTVELGAPARLNRVRLQEPIEIGQRVASFSVEVREAQAWKEVVSGKTIGARRVLRFPAVTADAVRVAIRESLACPALSAVEVYMAAAEEALVK